MNACGGANGVCNRQNLGEYRGLRWEESKRDNEHFFFGPGSLLLYGAASFLYELMPGSSHTANEAVSQRSEPCSRPKLICPDHDVLLRCRQGRQRQLLLQQ